MCFFTTFTHFPDSHPYLDSHPSVFLSRSLSFFVCLFLVRFLTLILNYFYLLTNHKLWTDTSTQSSVGSITVLKIQKKYKVLVAQSCPTLCDPMNCSLPGSSLSMGILQARILDFLLQGIFLTQGLNPSLLHCRQILYYLSHQGSPIFKRAQYIYLE